MKTMMSPVLIVPNSTLNLFTRIRSPICSVGIIDDDGMKLLGVFPRRALPLAYLKYREVVSAGRTETTLPPENSQRRPPKVYPTLPLIGQEDKK